MKMIAGAVMLALVASACGSDADTEEAPAAQPTSVQCSGSDAAPGLELSINWSPEESREFTRAHTSSGAGVPPDIDGITLTNQLSIAALDTATEGTLLDVSFAGGGSDEPELGGFAGVRAQFGINSDGEVVDEVDGPLAGEIARDIEVYHLVTAIGDGETTGEPSSTINPLTASVEDATLTIEHLGLDDQGCEVIRVTRHIGPDEVIDDLDTLLDQLEDPEESPDAFAEVGFDGVIVRTTTYRFDHGIDRLRSVEFTEAWGIFGAGGIDTTVQRVVLSDTTDQ